MSQHFNVVFNVANVTYKFLNVFNVTKKYLFNVGKMSFVNVAKKAFSCMET